MTHSYKSHYFHIIWSTKQRCSYISENIEPELYNYISGVLRNHNVELLEIGGMPVHIHLLLRFRNLDNFSNVIKQVKTSTSCWMNQQYFSNKAFSWQEGYASFSTSVSLLENVRKYIISQKEHHKKFDFAEEYTKFLKSHNIDYDERFILG